MDELVSELSSALAASREQHQGERIQFAWLWEWPGQWILCGCSAGSGWEGVGFIQGSTHQRLAVSKLSMRSLWDVLHHILSLSSIPDTRHACVHQASVIGRFLLSAGFGKGRRDEVAACLGCCSVPVMIAHSRVMRGVGLLAPSRGSRCC